MIETRVFLPEGKQRVSPFYHPSIHQISTLEKTKLCHRPILRSLLNTSFQQIAGSGLARDLCHGQQLVSPFYQISQLVYPQDFPGALAIRLIIGLDFAVRYYRHHFWTIGGTEMVNVEQTQKDDSIRHV